MNRYFNPRFNKNLIDLAPGEFYATTDDVLLTTVLGSCVSVVIHDKIRKMGGLNHFMLVEGRNIEATDELLRRERYGSYAMEALLNEFYRTGSRKENLQAKIFGGSRILQTMVGSRLDIGEQNIKYAHEFLTTEGIPILAQDTGGDQPRRFYLYPNTFRVLMNREKLKTSDSAENLYSDMKKYQRDLEKAKNRKDDIVLFT